MQEWQHLQGNTSLFSDSDDEWLPDKLRIQVLTLNEKPANVRAVYTGLTALSQKDNKIVGERHPIASGDLQSALYAENCIGPLSTLVVRRTCLDMSELFDEGLPSCQDWDFCIQLASVCHFEAIGEALHPYLLGIEIPLLPNCRQKLKDMRLY